MAITRDYNLAKLLTDSGFTVDDIVVNDAMSVGGNTNIDLGTLYIDSVNNRVGINDSAPAVALDITGQMAVSANSDFSTNTLFVDSLTSRVGIGKNNPTTLLDVNGATTTTTLAVTSTSSFTANVAVNTDDLFVDTATSRVGINTTPGAFALDVAGGVNISADLAVGANVNVTSQLNVTANANFSQIIATANVNFDSGTLFVDATSNNVGIGTTTPSTTLEVVGDLTITTGDLVGPHNIKGDKEGLVVTLTAASGQNFSNGDIGYMASGGVTLADASAESTAKGSLFMAIENVAATASGKFMRLGVWVTSGLTQGTEYYLSETAGAYTSTRPTTSASIVRVVGTALSTTELMFDPSGVYVENL